MNRPPFHHRGIETKFGEITKSGRMKNRDKPSFYLHTKEGLFELSRISGTFGSTDESLTAEIGEIDKLIRAGNPNA